MFSRKGMLVIVMAAAACAATQSRPCAPWRVSLATSGGFTGRGSGGLAIDSLGEMTVTTMAGKSCSSRAGSEELSNLRKLLGRTKPEKWGRYVPENECCDRITYTLTLEEADQKYNAEWIDDPQPMPEDLVKLAEALSGLQRKHGEQCR
jgi:hypothetical protein